MFFEEPNLEVEILSVLELSWSESHAYAAPRSFNALSYRISGGATFTHNGICKTVKAGEIAYVPAGFEGKLSVNFVAPVMWRIAEIISIVSLVILMIVIVREKRKDNAENNASRQAPSGPHHPVRSKL